MNNIAIKVENLGKKYIIDHLQNGGHKSLRETITSRVKSITSRISNPAKQSIHPSLHEEFWALKDISFEIKQGECIGVIGRNGAGKSTLLKILSRITEPTRGSIRIKGRVASLLEVGTGFHGELSGRENIYLNGAILGMSQAEIKRKFDEIVDFAEIEKFLDTPVKRYSSGMYVRLAFAVAAHLEPEILIVDEVLAVGDTAFQKKCLGKMENVTTQEGRTVLFVSHNMQPIAQLTNRCLLLSKGEVEFDGHTDKAVRSYLLGPKDDFAQSAYYQAPANKTGNYLAWARVQTSEEDGFHSWGKPIVFEFALHVTQHNERLRFAFQVVSAFQQPICHFWSLNPHAPYCQEPGTFILRCEIPKFRLYMGSYHLRTWFSERCSNNILLENLQDICPFEVTMIHFERAEYEWQHDECVYLDDAVWKIHKDESQLAVLMKD